MSSVTCLGPLRAPYSLKIPVLSFEDSGPVELGSHFVFSLTFLWAPDVAGSCRICDCFDMAEVGCC